MKIMEKYHKNHKTFREEMIQNRKENYRTTLNSLHLRERNKPSSSLAFIINGKPRDYLLSALHPISQNNCLYGNSIIDPVFYPRPRYRTKLRTHPEK